MSTPANSRLPEYEVHDDTWMIDTPDGQCGVRVRRPSAQGRYPLVLMFHHGPGLDEGTLDAMGIFARAGYFVVSPDRYYREGPWITFDGAELMRGGPDSELMGRFFGLLSRTTDEMVARDAQAVLERATRDPAVLKGRMGCVGYCVGARSVIRAMNDHPEIAAGIMLHPGQCVFDSADSPHLSVPTLSGELYASFGADDHMSSVEQNQPLIHAIGKLGTRGLVEIHDGADHGFAVPGPNYSAVAAERSYAQALDLLGRTVRRAPNAAQSQERLS